MIYEKLALWYPLILTIMVGISFFYGVKYLLYRNTIYTQGISQAYKQLVLVAIAFFIGVMSVITFPINDATQGQLLSFFGIIISAAVALSSTTFVGNAMAGLMLKTVANMKPGDFLRVGEHFGRVTELGLLSSEIQTENRELTSLPNIHLIKTPVTVIRSSGTIVSATVSLGYDLDNKRMKYLLQEAAEKSELDEAYVQVVELGNYSVVYRVSGFLSDPKLLLESQSRLKSSILDVLHENEVEIVSPSFMYQRRDDSGPVISKPEKRFEQADEIEEVPEDLIFDKANEAEINSQMILDLESVLSLIDRLTHEQKEEKDPKKLNSLNKKLQRLKIKKESLALKINAAKNSD